MPAWTHSGTDHSAASLKDVFFRSCCYTRRIVNVIQIRYLKPPKRLILFGGACMCKVCTSVLTLLLLGHTLTEQTSFVLYALLQPSFLSTNFEWSVSTQFF